MDDRVHEQWLQDYKDWKASGTRFTSWAREHGIKPSTFRGINAVVERMLDQRGDITCDESHRMNFVEAVINNLSIQNTEGCLVIDAPGVHVEVNALCRSGSSRWFWRCSSMLNDINPRQINHPLCGCASKVKPIDSPFAAMRVFKPQSRKESLWLTKVIALHIRNGCANTI